MMSKNKNVSKTIINGIAVKFKDGDLEYGTNTKKPGHEIRFGNVVDSNRDGNVAIVKKQNASNAIKIGINLYNPNLKTKDKNGNPLTIDGVILKRANEKNDITKKQADDIKKQALKERPKNIRKPNKRRLRELKGRR